MSAAMSLFVVNDTLMKQASAAVPAMQAIFLRGLFASGWLCWAVLVAGQWRQWRGILTRPVLFRAALDVLGTVGYLLALFQIPLAAATAISLSGPLGNV